MASSSSDSSSSSSSGCCKLCCGRCVQRYRRHHAYEHTSIPIREEFRCKRFLFSYHDLRAFTTSVLPQPIFIIYRVILLFYLLLWILYDGIEEGEGAGYLVFFTTMGYILLVIGILAMTIASTVYFFISYFRPKWIKSRIPQYSQLQPRESFFQQDNTPWYLKICWFLYVLGVTPSLPIVFVYWVFVGSDVMVTPENVHLHGLNFVFALIDILISRVPIQLFHFYILMLFGLVYSVFLAIFYAVGGMNPNDGGNYVYKFVDFGTNPGLAVGICIALIFIGAIVHTIYFGIAQLRDMIAKCIPKCYWNIESVHTDVENQPIDMLREAWLISSPSMHGRGTKKGSVSQHLYSPEKMTEISDNSKHSIKSFQAETDI